MMGAAMGKLGRASLVVLVCGCLAGLPDAALAQPTTPREDPAKAAEAVKAIKARINFLADEASVAASEGNCERLKFWIRRLDSFSFSFQVDEYARKTYGVILRPIGQPDEASALADYAGVLLQELWRQYLKICGPPKEETETEVSLGGGASRISVPVIPIGTERKGDEEFALAETDDELTGGSFNAEMTVPLGSTYRGYVNYQFTEADGSSRASVPPGEREVAITFPFANPETDSTGIGPGLFGLDVSTHTDVEMNDVSAGFGGSLNLFDSVATSAFIGFRYMNYERKDQFQQWFREFPDVGMNTNIGQDTDFYGPQFGISAEGRPPAGSGFTYGASASITFFASDTSAGVRSLVDCAVCPLPDDHKINLVANLDDNDSSMAFTAEAHVGYRFGQRLEVSAIARVTHMTDVPVVLVPVSPEETLALGEDDLDSATVGLRVTYDLGYPPPD
jgi:hypothetical protein